VIVVVMALLPVLDLIVTTEMTLLDNARDDRVIVMAVVSRDVDGDDHSRDDNVIVIVMALLSVLGLIVTKTRQRTR